MLKFLCFVSVLGLSFASFAQENALFPDLKRGGQNQAPAQQEPAPAPAPVRQGGLPPEEIPSLFANEDKSVVSREDIIERVNERGFGDVLDEAGEDSLSERLSAGVGAQGQENAGDDANKKRESSGQFIISPTSVQIIEPSIARFQFCMADITIQNDTDTTLRNLNAIIHYTPIDMPFGFSNIAPGKSTTQKIYMATEGCQKLVTTPPVTIKVCQADGMTEEECKAAVKYVTNLQMVSEEVQ